jgi:NAD dependent epimerase/dehydratase family enzyme
MVLARTGGALPALLPPFRWGLGGPVGSGRQWWSWISLDDLTGAILHALATDALAGPVNAVAPVPVTNRDFARTLGRVLGRPALLPLPARAARLLLASARVVPARLEATGFAFGDATLERALRRLLGR